MNILVSNDDGVHSYGIEILARELSKIGVVYIAAPLHNQSGAGHGLTVTTPLRARQIDFPAISGQAWAIEGTPADCVKLSLEQLLPVKPDIMLSGINNGPNLGTDVIYSGTVAAAMEGYFHGIPAIAVSVAGPERHTDRGNYQLAAETAADFARKLVDKKIPRTLLNINVPGMTPEDVNGVRYTSQGWRWYTGAYERRCDPWGKDYFWLQGQVVDEAADGTTDVEVCAEGYISVTPLSYDLTNRRLLHYLRE